MSMRGHAHKFGAHIDTDQIIPAKFLVTTDPKTLGEHVMENSEQPDFAQRVQRGDVIVADVNFGCGSSREHAPISIRGAGVSCVIAKSFARIFFRNAINQGLPVLECPEAVDAIHAGDELEVDLATGTIRDLTTEEVFVAKPYEPFLLELLEAGGIIEYTKRKLAAAKP
jgi:3-isopropylmalate/(R)-2-methylmalate dehydratase small subunit